MIGGSYLADTDIVSPRHNSEKHANEIQGNLEFSGFSSTELGWHPPYHSGGSEDDYRSATALEETHRGKALARASRQWLAGRAGRLDVGQRPREEIGPTRRIDETVARECNGPTP